MTSDGIKEFISLVTVERGVSTVVVKLGTSLIAEVVEMYSYVVK